MLLGCGLFRVEGQFNNSGYHSLKPSDREILKSYDASLSAGCFFEDEAVFEVGIKELEGICNSEDTVLLKFWVAGCSSAKNMYRYIEVVRQNRLKLYLIMRDYDIQQLQYLNSHRPLLAKVYVLKYADFTDRNKVITDRYKKSLEIITGKHFDQLPIEVILYKNQILAINEQADRFLLSNR